MLEQTKLFDDPSDNDQLSGGVGIDQHFPDTVDLISYLVSEEIISLR